MNLKKLLTKVNPFYKKKMPISVGGGRPRNEPEHEPVDAVMPVDAAIHTIPDELIKQLDSYKSIKGGRSGKLNQNQQLELMEFIARFATIDEINTYFVQNYKITITNGLMQQYKRTAKWQPIIKKLREKYLLEEDEIPGRHRRVRMDRADKIYNKAMKADDLKVALQATRDQHEMIEGNKAGGNTNLTFNQYNVMSDEEVEAKREWLLSKIKNVKLKEIKNGPTEERTKD